MRRILSLFLSFHWMIVFAALATLCATDREGGFSVVLHAIGITAPESLPYVMTSQLISMGFASAFGLVSILFLWTLLTALFETGGGEGTDDVARLAFGSAIVVLTILFVICVPLSAKGLYGVVALELAALAGSWLALSAERRMVGTNIPEDDSVQATARHMALGAAHSSLLHRLHGHLATEKGGRR